MEGNHPQDFVAMFSYALTGAHSSILYRQASGLGKALRYRISWLPGPDSNHSFPRPAAALPLKPKHPYIHLYI
jgi:hypothetical protein